MDYQFANDSGSMIIGTRPDGSAVLIEPGQEAWPLALAAGPSPYIAPALPDPLIAERAAMVASRFQTRAALYVAGLLPMVEDSIARADPLTQMAWAEAVIFKRASPTIAKLAEGLGLDEATIDELFRSAMAIEV
jgi:hypothetical protein